MAKLEPLSAALPLLLLLSLLAASAAAFSPADNYLLNCGSRAAATLDSDHRLFAGDEQSPFLASTRTTPLESTGPDPPSPIYRTARAFTRPAHYAFPVAAEGGTAHHLVRLHFYPIPNSFSNLSDAEFHVVVNEFVVLRDFRVPEGGDFPVIKEFVVPVVSDEVRITLVPSGESGFGFVSAVEVISAPRDLIADVAQLIGFERNERVQGLLKSGFETVYRFNVGGFKVTPFNDSLWRTWRTDDEYLTSGEGSEKVHFGGRIKYQMGGASREVGPDNVYNTARVIKSLDDSVPNVNMTWSFEVVKGYRYMVRMHFCNIASVANDMLYFNVYVNGNLAYEDLDLSEITNRLLASPFYADFLVDGDSSGNLVVSVGPSKKSWPRAVDAILNGIEIWKLNNTMGSFDGEVCAEFVLRSWRRGHTSGGLLPFVAVVFLLLSLSVFLQRRRDGSVGWARLPVDVSEANLTHGNQLSSIKA